LKSEVAQKLMQMLGFKELYPPQKAAVEAGVEEGQSLLVSSPTASGKTFIAMTALASAAMRGLKAFYTSPLRSIAMEKYRQFREVLPKLSLRVGISIGDLNVNDEAVIKRSDVVITTYEKLDSIIRNSPSLVGEIGALVVDEIHYVDDDKRGPVIETLLSKVMYKSKGVQVVALSATVSNVDEIARWLNAKLVASDWRPVPLSEGVYKDGVIHFADGSKRKVEEVSVNPSINLVVDESKQGGQTLVFAQSRRRAVQLAKAASKLPKGLLSFDQRKAREYAAKMMSTEGPRLLREELAGLISLGVSYHHAGLSNEQRTIIEDAFREGALAAIFATPTLAAGVNLPARRVVIAEVDRYDETQGVPRDIKVFEYKQFAGRAGRPGLDPYGEAIIVASRPRSVKELMEEYIKAKPERLESRLYGVRGLRHSALGAIASGVANDFSSLLELHRRTLYYIQRGEERLQQLLRMSVDDLVAWGLVTEADGKLRATELGDAVSRTYLDPASVPKLRKLIKRVHNKFTTEALLYIISSMPDMNPLPLRSSEAEKIMDIAIERVPMIIDIVDWDDPDSVAALKTTLALLDWVEEISDDKIAETYDVGPGDVASVIDTAKWIANSLADIAPAAGLPEDVGGQLRVLARRIESGVRPELLPLVEIPGIGRVRARRLYSAGFKTLESLASASPQQLLRVPGLGPATVASILEFFGRKDEAASLKGGREEGVGLDRFA